MSPTIQALVVAGYGINCEEETALAVERVGAEASILHLEDLLARPSLLEIVDWVLFPGGFSFGDELGGGRVYANKMRNCEGLVEGLTKVVHRGGSLLGICNGFQLLVNLGLLPGSESTSEPSITLAPNHCGKFVNRWCYHQVLESPCIYTKGMGTPWFPIRHGEGRVQFENPAMAQQLIEAGQVPMVYANPTEESVEYPWNPNGSPENIAGICDPTGRIFGLMPHPEAFIEWNNHPHYTRMRWTGKDMEGDPDGLQLFRNAVQALQEIKQTTALELQSTSFASQTGETP